MRRNMTGTFIVLDGPDGSGTSTHATQVVKTLGNAGKKALLTAEPTNGPVGKLIRTLIRAKKPLDHHCLQLLFCADRAQHMAEVIQPALQQGRIVVCDRYVPSTLAYGLAGGLDRGWLKLITTEFRRADLTIFLLPPFPVSFERVEARKGARDAFEQRQFQQEVHRHYKRLSEEDISILTIDSSAPKQQIADQIMIAVLERLP